ncbi:MAG: hypothetical protein JNM98_10115 [Rhodocyclaceae bacterium]|nr:hypothetical protein [Rhodocyclaceae bacterium]
MNFPQPAALPGLRQVDRCLRPFLLAACSAAWLLALGDTLALLELAGCACATTDTLNAGLHPSACGAGVDLPFFCHILPAWHQISSLS